MLCRLRADPAGNWLRRRTVGAARRTRQTGNRVAGAEIRRSVKDLRPAADTSPETRFPAPSTRVAVAAGLRSDPTAN
ncbi:MAG TPA: hypothetical protein VM818_20220 [Vicinamibacterales bacterium]|nr:hypothetical protein [Vicinamibacterales bacterium]